MSVWPPLSVYIHLPWCVRKCPYCDFNSHTAGDQPQRQRYVAALLTDLQQEAVRAKGREISSVFLGGGTPSLFTPAEIATILERGLSGFNLSDNCEITMETNPGALERGDLAEYRKAGVNRLSIGGQSFNAEHLKILGRIHGPDEIVSAYEEACAAGYDSINIDLMFALPTQDVELAMADMQTLLRMSPPHVSYYHLTLEPNTIFHQRPPSNIPDDELSWSIQSNCHAMLLEAGYEQYEISAFARPGHACRHNLNYWLFGDYIAAGCGAHGKYTNSAGDVMRYCKVANPLNYMQQAEAGQLDTAARDLSPAELSFEYMLNVLRLKEGFTEADFEARTGLDIGVVSASMAQARDDGLLHQEGQRWRPSTRGFRFLNDLQARFLT